MPPLLISPYLYETKIYHVLTLKSLSRLFYSSLMGNFLNSFKPIPSIVKYKLTHKPLSLQLITPTTQKVYILSLLSYILLISIYVSMYVYRCISIYCDYSCAFYFCMKGKIIIHKLSSSFCDFVMFFCVTFFVVVVR